jgi:hypothetical protein
MSGLKGRKEKIRRKKVIIEKGKTKTVAIVGTIAINGGDRFKTYGDIQMWVQLKS